MADPPTFELERQYWEQDIELIAGVDEVGMGALAGPVVAGAVVFEPDIKPPPPPPYQGESKASGSHDSQTLIKQFAYVPYRRILTEAARDNRTRQTPAEERLWKEVLRAQELKKYKFIRQKPLLNFIADFYCQTLGLVIEVDGDSHDRKQEYDRLRTEALKDYGIQVIRYSNEQILRDVPGVDSDLRQEIGRIEQNRRGQIKPTGSPPDKGEVEGVSGVVIRDSKQMTARQREKAAVWIKEQALGWGIGEASVEEITALNIRQASFLAMQRAVLALKFRPHLLFVDGPPIRRAGSPGLNKVENSVDKSAWHDPIPAVHVIKGDAKCFSIAAASILAKVYRDEVMMNLDKKFPAYKMGSNKGYGSQAHREALLEHGATPWHRPTYAPVARLIDTKKAD